MNNYSECVKDAKNALEYDAKNIKAYHRLGLAYRKMNLMKQCLQAFTAACALDPENKVILSELEATKKLVENKRKVLKQSLVKL